MSTKRSAAVVFIHGLAKKPPEDELLKLWRWGLARGNPNPAVFPPPNTGLNLKDDGVPHVLNYWADVFYGTDTETDFSSYYESNENFELAAENLTTADRSELPPPNSIEGRQFVAAVEAKLAAHAALLPSAPPTEPVNVMVDEVDLEIAAWLPEPVKGAIIKKVAMEAYYYLFDQPFSSLGSPVQVRAVLRQRLIDKLKLLQEKAERLIIVSHSMGTMIAYDVLRRCPECPSIHTLITLGSPLGVTEVQEKLVADGFSRVDFPDKLTRWINIYDPLDPVCGADPRLRNDYAAVNGKLVEDVREDNWGKWRHTITHYLAGTQMRRALSQALTGP
jgi:hypothetical protein